MILLHEQSGHAERRLSEDLHEPIFVLDDTVILLVNGSQQEMVLDLLRSFPPQREVSETFLLSIRYRLFTL